jgi:hypothetical protein
VESVLPLTGSLALGTPALSFIGAAAAALTASLRRGGLILPVLVAPLCLPVLIFGVSASDAARSPMSLQSPLLILAALSLMAAVVGCIAAAAALRQPDFGQLAPVEFQGAAKCRGQPRDSGSDILERDIVVDEAELDLFGYAEDIDDARVARFRTYSAFDVALHGIG